jgi:acyl-homoserine-lactone acylase
VRLARAAVATCLLLGGCGPVLQWYFAATVPSPTAHERVEGLHAPVVVSRDTLGIPLIEAENDDDLAFAMGYVAAEDRLSQMVGLKMTAAGRLAEMSGKSLLELDIYMRCLNLDRVAQALYAASSPRTKRTLQRYADGVNAYVANHPLPPDLQLAKHQPEAWLPEDSARVLALINAGLTLNAREEITYLKLAQRLGAERAAWLMPIYPDEPLPIAEAAKLAAIDLDADRDVLDGLTTLELRRGEGWLRSAAASNGWAVHPSRSANGATILANDTHLPLAMPSIWHVVHLRAPGYHAAGVAIAGAPVPVLGFNGRLAWGATLAMSDTQDVFLEELRTIGGKLHYRRGKDWLPTRERQEQFRIRGEQPATRTFHETRHGPLLNSALSHAFGPELTPAPVKSRYGLALSSSALASDATLDGVFGVSRAQSVAEATPIIQSIRAISLHYVYADHDHIASQVTGLVPLRARGRGKLPSPGWSDDYEWSGYLPVAQHPAQLDPLAGFIGMANQRVVPPDSEVMLSSSWFYPERGERISELLGRDPRHALASTLQMQYDQHSGLAAKVREVFARHPLAVAITRMPAAPRAAAHEALARLATFDGDMGPDSRDGALFSAFLHRLAIRTFGDELGYPDDLAWKAFVTLSPVSYSAIQDHLLGREDSPFWDDVTTPATESKADILGLALAGSIDELETRLGKDRAGWRWGRLHTYRWETDAGKLATRLGGFDKWAFRIVREFFDAGPFAAGGDHTTLNAATYAIGASFDTLDIPTMRLVVDFAQDDPMMLLNSSGQSGNPASAHYRDGIHAWLEGRYQRVPFESARMKRHYSERRRLVP